MWVLKGAFLSPSFTLVHNKYKKLSIYQPFVRERKNLFSDIKDSQNNRYPEIYYSSEIFTSWENVVIYNVPLLSPPEQNLILEIRKEQFYFRTGFRNNDISHENLRLICIKLLGI
jgi:hypothetical protein